MFVELPELLSNKAIRRHQPIYKTGGCKPADFALRQNLYHIKKQSQQGGYL